MGGNRLRNRVGGGGGGLMGCDQGRESLDVGLSLQSALLLKQASVGVF